MSLTLIAARRTSTVSETRGPSPLLSGAPLFVSPPHRVPVCVVFRLIRFSVIDRAHACLFSVSQCTAARSVNLLPAPFAIAPVLSLTARFTGRAQVGHEDRQ